MELVETTMVYRAFTKNDRGVGEIAYRKDDTSEDIIFKPYFHKQNDPWIGGIDGSIDNVEWKTNRNLFGRYLDDPDFYVGCPRIGFSISLDIRTPDWIGQIHAAVSFENRGTMDVFYFSEKVGPIVSAEYKYEGEITIESTKRFAYEKITEDQTRIEAIVNIMPPPPSLTFEDDDD